MNPGHVGYIADGEMFFRVPIVPKYPELHQCAISTRTHLIKQRDDGSWFTPELTYHHFPTDPTADDWSYGFIRGKRRIKIPLDEIVRYTFFPDAKRIFYPCGEDLQRNNKSAFNANGKSRKLRPIRHVSLYVLTNGKADIVNYIQAKCERQYTQIIHEFVNVPEMPALPDKPRAPRKSKPQVLDDGTPVNDIRGLDIDFINKKYTYMVARVFNQNYKNAPGRESYKYTTMADEWRERINFQHFMNDNYYEYEDTDGTPIVLELEKDIFSMMELDEYGPDVCCFVPHFINSHFRSIKAERERQGRPYTGYRIVINESADHPFILQALIDKRTGYTCEHVSFDRFEDALQEGRKRKADRIRSIVEYETPRGFIPQKILDKISEYPPLIEQGKIDAFEPSKDILLKYMGEEKI